MTRVNLLRKYNTSPYIEGEHNEERVIFFFPGGEHLSSKLYTDGELKMFERIYDDLSELKKTFEEDLTVKDMKIPRFKELVQRTKRVVKRYEKYVPEEFRKKFYIDIGKLEETINELQKEFYKDQLILKTSSIFF